MSHSLEQLSYNTTRNARDYRQECNTRINIREQMNLDREIPQNTDNQLALNYYGQHQYNQNFTPSPQVIRPMSYYENGRNLALLNATNNRMIDTSGTLYQNKDLRTNYQAYSRAKLVDNSGRIFHDKNIAQSFRRIHPNTYDYGLTIKSFK